MYSRAMPSRREHGMRSLAPPLSPAVQETTGTEGGPTRCRELRLPFPQGVNWGQGESASGPHRP